MKHLVYKIIFQNRLKKLIQPYYYVGCKANSIFKNGKIYDKNKKEYYGSSRWEGYNFIVASDECVVEILREFDNYTEALNFESQWQKNNDVVASSEYFNLGIATVNNFTDPNYATYTNGIKTVRLKRSHPKVINGEYYGITKGIKLTEEEKRKKGRKGTKNSFYGKKHTKETKEKISKKNKGRVKSQKEINNWIEKVAKKPKSKEHRKKIGRKGFKTVKHLETGETKRVPINSKLSEKWVNPFKWKKIYENS